MEEVFLPKWIILVKMVTAIYNMVGKYWSLKIQPMSRFQVNCTGKRTGAVKGTGSGESVQRCCLGSAYAWEVALDKCLKTVWEEGDYD